MKPRKPITKEEEAEIISILAFVTKIPMQTWENGVMIRDIPTQNEIANGEIEMYKEMKEQGRLKHNH